MTVGTQPMYYGAFRGSPGYIGVRFDKNVRLTYGWIAFVASEDVTSAVITDWAFESVGDSAHAGDRGEGVVPEPSGLALLAAGAAGLAALRKKRAA